MDNIQNETYVTPRIVTTYGATLLTPRMAAVFEAVALERLRQEMKWGQQNHDPYRWLAILSEEIGEAAQAALHDEFGGRAAGTLRDELVQVAAVAISWIECIDRNGGKGGE